MLFSIIRKNKSIELSEELLSSVKSYIDENYVAEKMPEEYGGVNRVRGSLFPSRRKGESPDFGAAPDIEGTTVCEAEITAAIPCFLSDETDDAALSLEEVLASVDAGFSETLLKLIDETGKKDSEIYKKANVDRKLFSKIRNNPDYKPSKPTALAFALALELDLDATRDFIARAGFALSHSSKFDLIVEYFIREHRYDIFELNAVLFQFDQPLIGA